VLAVAEATVCGPDEIAGRFMVPSNPASETARYTQENRLSDMYRIILSIEQKPHWRLDSIYDHFVKTQANEWPVLILTDVQGANEPKA
jgi:hypothetical protein